MGVATAEAAQDLHPREWAMLQTALSNAQHRALMALVHAYAGFQIHKGQFYVVESRVAPYISIEFATFNNYLTDLKKLGLLDMLWRCPNQYGEKSIWRMNLDVVLSTGQMAIELPVEDLIDGQEGGGEAAQPEVELPEVEYVNEPVRPSEAVEAEPSSGLEARGHAMTVVSGADTWRLHLMAGDKEALRKEMEQMSSEEIQGHINNSASITSVFSSELERRQTRNVVTAPALTRAERRRQKADRKRVTLGGNIRARKKGKGSETGQTTEAALDARSSSPLVRDVEGLMRESFDMPSLSDAEVLRVAALEREWRVNNSGADVPRDFLVYAATEATKSARSDFTAYMLSVLEASLRRGYGARLPSASKLEQFRNRSGGFSGERLIRRSY